MSTPNNALATISTDALVTATGGFVGHQIAHLDHLLTNTVNTQAQNQNNENTQMMTMGMLALAMRDR